VLREPEDSRPEEAGLDASDPSRGAWARDGHYLLYDYLQVAGGAERLTLVLASVAQDFRLVVSRIYPEVAPLLSPGDAQATVLGSRGTRWMGRIPEAIYCFLVRTRHLSLARVVLYSGFYAPLAVYWQSQGRRLYYCHTIPRYAYDLHEHTASQYPWLLRPLFRTFCAALRWSYERALRRMDVLISNSENVRSRLRQHTGLESIVIHPPILTSKFKWLADGDYYLSTARLEPLKRVEVIVRAFAGMPKRKLVVASGGSQSAQLREIAKGAPNIRFTGWLEEDEWAQLLGKARAVIYLAVDEDFGMSPVEAMSAGKPVIAAAEGGLLETVVHRRTGWLLDGEVTPERVVGAVEALEQIGLASMREACERRAQAFGACEFKGRMLQMMRSV
jgi:glycosyltransferase involved in cell wall biosynthesis